jgi:hypothetical protein
MSTVRINSIPVLTIDEYYCDIRGNPVQEYLNREKESNIDISEMPKPNKYIRTYMQKNKFVKYIDDYIKSLDWKRVSRCVFINQSHYNDIEALRTDIYKIILSQSKVDYQNIIHVLNGKSTKIKANMIAIMLNIEK